VVALETLDSHRITPRQRDADWRHVGCKIARAMGSSHRVAIALVVMLASPTTRAEHAHSIYVEAFGKGGLWGVGFDHRLNGRYRVGAVGSGAKLDDERYLSLSPYIGLAILRHGRSSWFADFGAQLAHVWADSPVPEWDGDSSTGVGGIASTGYEFRGRLLFRLYVHGVIGKGGAAPWAGTGLGLAF
jgi:hypothetical protein